MQSLKNRRWTASFLGPCVGLCAITLLAAPVAAQEADANLDQARNGSASSPNNPVQWVNGNAGPANAHYLEGYSIPYRLHMTGFEPGSSHFIRIAFDTRKSGKNALDFITNYNRLEPHNHFGHPAEVIDPLLGLSGLTLTPPDPEGDDIIPVPASVLVGSLMQPAEAFLALPTDERRMTIYNGEITSIVYVTQQALGAGDSTTTLQVNFIANEPNVLLLWGGHIASQLNWGAGNSAANINGSPYHTSLAGSSFGNVGSQDRSLQASAVVQPPSCQIVGVDSVCPESINQFSGPAAPAGQQFTYEWTLQSNCGATFVGGGTTATTKDVNVVACDTCGEYTLNLVVSSNAGSSPMCPKVVAVFDETAPSIVGTIPPSAGQCALDVPAPVTTVAALEALLTGPGAGISDNCNGPLTLSHTDGSVTGNSCNGSFIRTYKVTDICGNFGTVQQTISTQDTIPPTVLGTIGAVNVQCINNIPAAVTTIAQFLSLSGITGASDNCTPQASLIVTHSDGPQVGSCPLTFTRTYTISDACGNSTNKTQSITVDDTVAPVVNGTIVTPPVQCLNQIPAAATTIAQFLNLTGIVSVSDNCTPQASLTISHINAPISGSCPATLVRTYFITDQCGNMTPKVHTIIIDDTTPPVIVGSANNASVQCINEVPAAATTIAQFINLPGITSVSDNCTAQNALTITHSDQTSGNGCPTTIVRTYTIRDACLNEVTHQQSITVNDTQPPVISLCLANPEPIECSSELPAAASTVQQFINMGGSVSDNCSSPAQMTISKNDVLTNGPECTSTIVRTYTIRDACNNEATCEQTFIKVDTTPPVIEQLPSEAAPVECGEELPVMFMTIAEFEAAGGIVTDNCGEDLTIQFISDQIVSEPGACPRIFDRLYEISDGCNVVEFLHRVSIQDTSPPEICFIPEVVGCIGYPIDLRAPAVLDECGMTVTPVAELLDGTPIPNPSTYPFPVGTTVVKWTAVDGCGNPAEPMLVSVVIKECPSYCTKSQSAWKNSPDGGAATIATLLAPVNGGPLVIGKKTAENGRSVTFTAAAADCLVSRLPASGTPGALPANLGNKNLNTTTCNTNPALPLNANGTFKNALIGNTIALDLNIRLDAIDGSGTFGALQLCPVMTTINHDGVVKTYMIPAAAINAMGANKSVNALRNLANKALAGRSIAPANFSAINTAVARVNSMFANGCQVALLSTSCDSSTGGNGSGEPHHHMHGATAPDELLVADESGLNSISDIGGSSTSDPSGTKTSLNSGILAPADTQGLAEFEGDFRQNEAGTLLIQLRGNEPVIGYDVVNVAGGAFLQGTLKVSVAEGFQPTIGDEFDILRANAIIGQFQNVDLAELPAMAKLQLVYGPNAVTVEVTERPLTGDLNESGNVDGDDLLLLLNAWGMISGPADLNHDGQVDASDLTMLLGQWGS